METTSPDREKLHALSSEVTELKKQVMDKKIDTALDAKKIAPDINLPFGFDGSDKHDMTGRCPMMGDCGMGGKDMAMKGCSMMGKGMGEMKMKMKCPAMNAHGSQDNKTQKQQTEPENKDKKE